MKRTKRIICLILTTLFLIVTLAGCVLFPVNSQRYRNQTAIIVGDTVVTLGEVIEYFNANALQYLQQGYGAQEVWDYLFPQLLTKSMVIDEYKKATTSLNTSDLAKKYENGEYVSDEAIRFYQKSVQSDLFATLEEMTLEELTGDGFVFNAEDEDRVKRLNKGWLTSLASEDFEKDENGVDEYLLKFQAQNSLESYDYIYKNEQDPRLIKAVEKLNKRIPTVDMETIDKKNPPKTVLTVKEYVAAQKAALKSLTRTIKNNYEMSIAEFAVNQIEENIKQEIVQLYSVKIYQQVENMADMDKLLQEKLENLTEQQNIKYALDPRSFVTFINSLSSQTGDDQFILAMPDEYKGEFFYVKNLVVEFSAEQKTQLERYRNMYGTGTADYIRARANMVKDIKLVDYSNEKAETSNVFSATSSGVVTSTAFDQLMAKEDFVSLTFKYTTDIATLNSKYDYVINRTPADKTNPSDEQFVPEFTTAARTVQNGGYTYCITDYGIHVIQYAGEVTTQTFNWSQKYYYGTDAGSLDYRFFRNFFDSVKTARLGEHTEELYTTFKNNEKIKITSNVLKKFLKAYSIKIDEKFIKNTD